jgi:hypothetical protein
MMLCAWFVDQNPPVTGCGSVGGVYSRPLVSQHNAFPVGELAGALVP